MESAVKVRIEGELLIVSELNVLEIGDGYVVLGSDDVRSGRLCVGDSMVMTQKIRVEHD